MFADSSNRRCKKACFIHLDSKKQRNRLAQNGAESILIAIPIFKNQVINSEEAFIYEKRHSIEKSFSNEILSFTSFTSPIDRCFRKANIFSDFRFEEKLATCQSTLKRSL